MTLRLACAMAAFACGAPLAAATAKQAPLIPDWKQSHLEEGNVAVRSLYRMAVCARLQKREAAEALLATVPGSAQEAELIRSVMPSGQTECPILTTRLTIRGWLLVRGAIAEAIYNGDGVRPRTASSLPLPEAFQPSRPGPELVVARWVARCAVRREPRLAHQVVKWNPGAIGEGRALRFLKPAFTACLPAGERLQASRLEIRALIAEELYRASVTFRESFANAKG